jgi:DNA polymerase I
MTLDAAGVDLKARFREVWCVDFEYYVAPDFRPVPWCMVAREWKSGREVRMWRDELQACRQAPFDVGPNALLVSYNVTAEMDCFASLGWRFPCNTLDLYVEYLAHTNKSSESTRKLIHALAYYGFPHMTIEDKKEWQQRAATQTCWSSEEQRGLLDYCAQDVRAAEVLLAAMLPHIQLPYALLRARYMQTVSRVEAVAIPVDAPLHRSMVEAWEPIKLHHIEQDGGPYGVYEGTTFREHLFAKWLDERGIYWPVTAQGRLQHKREVWRERAAAHPELEPLRRLRTNITELRINDLAIASDGRNRCSLFPFWTATGRNQPRGREYIYALPGWLRGLIKPPEGYGLAYVDFKAQEVAIAAALSADQAMIDGVVSGDPHLRFAVSARLAPPDATDRTHPEIRDQCKKCVLGQLFGQTPWGLAATLRISMLEARELHARHVALHPTFHRWREDIVASAQFAGRIETVFGWRQRVDEHVSKRTLMNFVCQANGAEMLRIAMIGATEAGLEICGPLHDALLLQARLEDLDDAISR